MSIRSSVEEVKRHITNIVAPVVAKVNMSLVAFGQAMHESNSGGRVYLLEAFDTTLEPSPVTPIADSGPFRVLSGTIKDTLLTAERYNSTGVVVGPSLGLGVCAIFLRHMFF